MWSGESEWREKSLKYSTLTARLQSRHSLWLSIKKELPKSGDNAVKQAHPFFMFECMCACMGDFTCVLHSHEGSIRVCCVLVYCQSVFHSCVWPQQAESVLTHLNLFGLALSDVTGDVIHGLWYDHTYGRTRTDAQPNKPYSYIQTFMNVLKFKPFWMFWNAAA